MRLGLYLHIPFCARRCDYCDFFVVVPGSESPRGAADGFAAWLAADLKTAAARLTGPLVADSVYFGGGTPSMLPPDDLRGILEVAADRFEIPPDAEITLEANPENVTAARAAEWLRIGINRVSLGVQSLSDAVLGPRGRLYTARQALEAARVVKEAGLPALSLDFIAGLPGESARSFAAGIERAVALAPEHLSIYLLELEESGKETPLARAVRAGRAAAPDDDETVEMLGAGARRLEEAGLARYEISNFARPGHASRHNLKYWTSEPWLGVGPSAHSHLEGRRYGRPASLDGWKEWVERGGDPAAGEYTFPGAAARAREALTLELRLTRGVDPGAFADRWGYDPREERREEIEEMRRAGLLDENPARLRLTERGMLFANEVFGRLT